MDTWYCVNNSPWPCDVYVQGDAGGASWKNMSPGSQHMMTFGSGGPKAMIAYQYNTNHLVCCYPINVQSTGNDCYCGLLMYWDGTYWQCSARLRRTRATIRATGQITQAR